MLGLCCAMSTATGDMSHPGWEVVPKDSAGAFLVFRPSLWECFTDRTRIRLANGVRKKKMGKNSHRQDKQRLEDIRVIVLGDAAPLDCLRTMSSTFLFCEKASMSETQHGMEQRVLQSVLHLSKKNMDKILKEQRVEVPNNIRRNQNEGQI